MRLAPRYIGQMFLLHDSLAKCFFLFSVWWLTLVTCLYRWLRGMMQARALEPAVCVAAVQGEGGCAGPWVDPDNC